jgi:hypothetical protein
MFTHPMTSTIVTTAPTTSSGRPNASRRFESPRAAATTVNGDVGPRPDGGPPDLALHTAQRGGRRFQRLARFQAGDNAEKVRRRRVEGGVAAAHERFRTERRDDVERAADLHAEEARWRDADDREGHRVETNDAAEDVRSAAELPLPVCVADHGDGAVTSSSASIVQRREGAAEESGSAKGREESAVNPHTVDELRLASRSGVESHEGPRGDTGEEIRTLANLFPERMAPRPDARLAGFTEHAVCDVNEPRGIVDRQRPEEKAVQNGEDRGAGANRDRKRQDRDCGHHRCLRERADGESHLAPELVHQAACRHKSPPGRLFNPRTRKKSPETPCDLRGVFVNGTRPVEAGH